jgi:hypothetical protein
MARRLVRGFQGDKKALRSMLLRGQLNRNRRTHTTRCVPRSKHPSFLEEDSVKILLRSVRLLDEWLKDNEGKLQDEVRVRRIKR